MLTKLLYHPFKALAFLMFIFMMTQQGFGQFYVDDKVGLTIEGQLSTKESEVIIKSDITGKGKIYFNSNTSQSLKTTRGITLPETEIMDNPDFKSLTGFHINGNLIISNASFTVNQKINLKGFVQLKAQTDIFGLDLIFENYGDLDYQFTAQTPTANPFSILMLAEVSDSHLQFLDWTSINQELQFYKNSFKSNNHKKPEAPPPKYCFI